MENITHLAGGDRAFFIVIRRREEREREEEQIERGEKKCGPGRETDRQRLQGKYFIIGEGFRQRFQAELMGRKIWPLQSLLLRGGGADLGHVIISQPSPANSSPRRFF